LFPSSSSLWPVRPIFPAQTRETCSSLRKDSQTLLAIWFYSGLA
jgi:hypothetical protein